MVKALDKGYPTAVQDMIKNHEELLYHPCPEKVLVPYLNHFVENGDLEQLKLFFEAVKGKNLLQKPADF